MAAAKDNSMMNILLIAGAAWLAYEFILKPRQLAEQMAEQMAALPPADTIAPTRGGNGAGSGGSVGSGGMTISQLEQKMKSAAQGDTNVFNVWRWNFYYTHVTGNPSPNVHLGFAFPNLETAQIEKEPLSFAEWLTKARQYAVNPESNTTGGWDPISQWGGGMGFIADRAKRGYSRAEGVGGMGRASWGQRGSAQFSNWAGGTAGRYRSRNENVRTSRPRNPPQPGRPVLEMPRRVDR